MGAKKYRKSSLRETLKVQFFLILIISANGAPETDISVTDLNDNQIVFHEKGYVINRSTFVHVRFVMNMTEYMDGIQEVINGLNSTFYDEKKHVSLNIYPFLSGDGKIDSIWPEGEFEGLYRKRASDGMFVTRWLTDMIQETVKDLKDILMVTPSAEEGDLHHQRTKRGIMGGIALGLAVRNAYQIHQIEKHFANLTSKYNEVVDSVTLLDNRHVQLAVDTEVLKNLVKIFQTRNYHKIITYVMAANDHMKRLIGSVRGIINDGRMKRLSSHLIHGRDLQLLYSKLCSLAREKRLQMILEEPADLYKVETTYAYEKEGEVFAIYVHVPMVEKEEKLKLYEYVKFPIIQSFAANATIIPDVGEEPMIAIVPIDQATRAVEAISQHRFRTMSETDIQSCQKIRDVYLCGGRNTLRTDIEDSCIGGLWLADHSIISRNCDMKISKSKEYVTKISANSWMVFSPKKLITTAKCGGTTVPVRFERQNKIVMPEDCQLLSYSHYLSTDLNINMDYKYKVIEWKFNGDVFEEFTREGEDVNKIIRGIVQTKSRFGLGDITHLKHYYTASSDQIAAIWEYLTSLNIFGWFGNFYMFLTFCMVIMILWLCYKGGGCTKFYRCLFKKKERGNRHRQRERSESVSRHDRHDIEANHLSYPILMPSLHPTRPSAPILESPNVSNLEIERELTSGRRIPKPNHREEGRWEEECNPGAIPEGLKLENFVCNHHVKKGAPGHCMGYYIDQ